MLLDTTPYLGGWFPQREASLVAVALSPLGFKAAKGLVAGVAATHPLASPQARIITARECSKVKNIPLMKTLNSARRFNVRDRLPSITRPSLIVVGDADVLADVRHARRMAKDIPNSSMVLVRGAGHMALFEKPEVVNNAMAEFLGRVYPPARKRSTA